MSSSIVSTPSVTFSDDAYKAAMSGGISSAIPKDIIKQRKQERGGSQRSGIGGKTKSTCAASERVQGYCAAYNSIVFLANPRKASEAKSAYAASSRVQSNCDAYKDSAMMSSIASTSTVSVSDDAYKAAMSGGIASDVPTKVAKQRHQIKWEEPQRSSIGGKTMPTCAASVRVQGYCIAYEAAKSGSITSTKNQTVFSEAKSTYAASARVQSYCDAYKSATSGGNFAVMPKAESTCASAARVQGYCAAYKVAMSGGISAAMPKVAAPARNWSLASKGRMAQDKEAKVLPAKDVKPLPPAVREYLLSALSADDARAVMHAGSTGTTVSTSLKVKTYSIPKHTQIYLDKTEAEEKVGDTNAGRVAMVAKSSVLFGSTTSLPPPPLLLTPTKSPLKPVEQDLILQGGVQAYLDKSADGPAMTPEPETPSTVASNGDFGHDSIEFKSWALGEGDGRAA